MEDAFTTEAQRELLDARVRARLDRVTATQNPKPVLEKAALREAHELQQTLTDDPDSLTARHSLGWLYWYRFQAEPEGRGGDDLRVAIAMFTVCFINGVDNLPERLLPLLADEALPTAMQVAMQVQSSSDPELLSSAVGVWERILAAIPVFPPHPNRVPALVNLAALLQTRFSRTGTTQDIERSITYLREAAEATRADAASRPVILASLGSALRARFEHGGNVEDLDAATGYLREVAQATPSDPASRAAILANLALVLRARFERTGAEGDLDAAIKAGQQAVHDAPADYLYRAEVMTALGKGLLARFGRTSAKEDLDAAISYLRQAVEAAPADHPDRPEFLSNLARALETQASRYGSRNG